MISGPGQSEKKKPRPVVLLPDGTPDPNCPPADEPEMSKGEKYFNWGVYSGLNYWTNMGLSLVITDFFLHNHTGKNLLQGGSETIAKMFTGAEHANYSKTLGYSRAGLKTLSLNSGGWLLLIPMKWLEDRKRPIVHWLNDKMGISQIAPDGHKETPDEIYIEQEQPKQSWLRVLGRRTIASGTTIGLGIWLDSAGAYTRTDEHGNTKKIQGQDRATDLITDLTNNTIKYLPGGDYLLKNQGVQRYIGYAALDTVYTWITSTIMHATNGAKKEKLATEIVETPINPNAVAATKKATVEAIPAETPIQEQPVQAQEEARPSMVERVEKKDAISKEAHKPMPASLAERALQQKQQAESTQSLGA